MKDDLFLEKNTLFHGRYRLKKFLGRGQFAEVWLAIDEQTNMSFALKIFAPATGMDESGAKMLAHEFSLVANVNHPNLLTAMHYDICDNKPYLVMPYCENGSCQKIIEENRPFDENDAWTFIHDVASGLACLHSHKPEAIIHQDIKPGNIMFGSEGHYTISDFGVSTRSRSNLRRSVGIVKDSDDNANGGTIPYMGPERWSSDPIPVKASDIWSLGATVYELITKTVPFGELGGEFQKGGAEIPIIKGNYSKELCYVIRSCMHYHTWDRPTAETLVRWSENRKADEGIGTTIRKQKNDSPRKPLVIGLSAATLVIGLFFAIRGIASPDVPDSGPSEAVMKNYLQLAESCRNYISKGDVAHARELLPNINSIEQRYPGTELQSRGEYSKLLNEIETFENNNKTVK